MYLYGVQSESLLIQAIKNLSTFIFLFSQKVAPYEEFQYDFLGDAVVIPRFTTDTIEVLREEEAYSFRSLVADIGGVLGLFIGFNFLMIWDWIVWGVKQISRKYYNK